MEKERTFWGIHAGQIGDAEHLSDKKNVVAIGWEDMGDLPRFKDRADIVKAYKDVYPQAKPGAMSVSAGQLFHKFPRKGERR